MAKNPPYGDGRRQGAVRDRSQTYNPKNDRWTKRDTETGKFIDQKADEDPFKGVRKEKQEEYFMVKANLKERDDHLHHQLSNIFINKMGFDLQ